MKKKDDNNNAFRGFLNNRKGGVFAFIIILFALFICMFLYVAFDSIVQNDLQDLSNETAMSHSVWETHVANWRMYPFALMVGLFIYGLLESAKREYGTYG